VEFRLLGAVEIDVDGRVPDGGTPQQRHVLAALLADVGQPVMTEALIDRVWDEAPVGARRTLQVQLTRVRQLLKQADTPGRESVRLVRRSGGYLLDLDPGRVDVHRLRHLVGQARELGPRDDERVVLLREALALWRGEPLAGLPGGWAERVREAWRQELLATAVAWADAELALGDAGAVIGRVTDLIGEYPLVEPLVAALMRSLYAVGRGADALDVYVKTRQRLVDELGTDPGPALQETHRAILRGDRPAVQPVAAPTRHPAVPAQLPPDLNGFTGRRDELAQLDQALAVMHEQRTAVPICCLSGIAGVGKTTLAVHWAHRVADRFPDGQLCVNLRGFDPSGQLRAPEAVLRGFLDDLGMPPAAVPADRDDQVRLYRSLVAGRRMLILLDNARDAAQVVDLLPGSPTCAVVVTSRDRLTDLVRMHGAQPLPLDVLDDAQSRELLRCRLGEERLAAAPEAVAAVIAGCGSLPLALSIAAARVAVHPTLTLAAIAEQLQDVTTRLNEFDDDGPQTSVQAALSWSHVALDHRQARVFALLGLAPGPDVSLPAAVALTGMPTSEVRMTLRALERQSLVQQHTPGRWRMHDLVRLYAAEQANRDEPQDSRAVALRRLVDFYLHTTYSADRLFAPNRPPITLDKPAAGSHPHALPDLASAQDWLEAEHLCLLATLQLATDQGWLRAVWQLVWSLNTYHHRRGYLHDQVTAWRLAVAAAAHTQDLAAQIQAHRLLGRACAHSGRHSEAAESLRQALALAEQNADSRDLADTRLALGQACDLKGDNQGALEHTRQALRLYQTLDDPVRTAVALNAVGWHAAHSGRYEEAHGHLHKALSLHNRHQHTTYQSDTLDSLGYLAHRTGQHADALHYYQQALALQRDLGDSYAQADTLNKLADTYAHCGQTNHARNVWRRALRMYQDQHRVVQADHIQHCLDVLSQKAVPGPV
jgi:DNA-binding SARP family transcriptional activator/tetratricopeptide (TPR) repeat protein